MYNTCPFTGINYVLPWTYDRPHTQISALRVLPIVPQHLSTVSIPHFTFRILPTADYYYAGIALAPHLYPAFSRCRTHISARPHFT